MKRILVIRRDNIGDLVLTTPLIHALRRRFPDAKLDVLTNSYCAPVLNGNPDVDQVHVYAKAHHRGERSVLAVYLDRIKLLWRLRRHRYDCIVLGKPQPEPRPMRLAQTIKAPMRVGVAEPGTPYAQQLSHPIYWREDVGPHLVERCMQMMEAFGEVPPAGPLRLFPEPRRVQATKALFREQLGSDTPVVAVQISARKIKQRWPLTHFAEFMRRSHDRHGVGFALIWSPGSPDNPMHPGDDDKLQALVAQLDDDIPHVAVPTSTIPDLIAALAAADYMVTSDGGALHIGAAVGLPTLCFFGNSEAARWHPWQVPYKLLQTETLDVSEIGVSDAVEAFTRLYAPSH
ncbi:MAG: glycosyltransferase family 9 protein [Gammaproteobacteria bacterium]|nr:glycosyltransferase family 9 protein [Gammaproteobacteria bacterium]